jgi:hypothetical protein
MKPRSGQVVKGDVIAFWRDRFSYLRDRLVSEPHGEDAWFWWVQWDILNYLLHRYTGEELQPPPGERKHVPFARVAEGTQFRLDEPEVASQSLRFRGSAKPPRNSSAIGPLLRNIVDGNRDRHSVLEHLRDELAKEKILQRELNQAAIGWMMEYRRIYGLSWEPEGQEPPAREQLSEDQIVEMLSELIGMDRPPEEPKAGDDDAGNKRI